MLDRLREILYKNRLEDDLVSLLGEIKELSGCMEIVSNVIYNRDLVKLIHNYILVDLVDRQIWIKQVDYKYLVRFVKSSYGDENNQGRLEKVSSEVDLEYVICLDNSYKSIYIKSKKRLLDILKNEIDSYRDYLIKNL